MLRRPAVLASSLLLLVALTGCSQAEEAAKGAASKAACSVANKVAGQVADQAQKAADGIDADPQAAQRKLSALRASVTAAEGKVDGDVKTKLAEVGEALDGLLGQAKDAAQGTPADPDDVGAAKDDLADAVDDVRNVC